MTAKPGQGEQLARHLLDAAENMRDESGCELYLVNRETADPDVVWVTELWRSQADLDRVVDGLRGKPEVAETVALATEWRMIELEPLGGKGPATGGAADG